MVVDLYKAQMEDPEDSRELTEKEIRKFLQRDLVHRCANLVACFEMVSLDLEFCKEHEKKVMG